MIGGKVLDPSAFVAHIRGNLALQAWLDTAAQKGIVLYLPDMSLAEVLAIYHYDPPAEQRLGELRNHPCAVQGTLDRFDAGQVAGLLEKARMWDVTAGHVIYVARRRGWPVLTADPGRLRRIAPDVDVDLIQNSGTALVGMSRRTIPGQPGRMFVFVLVSGRLLVVCKSVGLAFQGSNP